MKHPIAGTVLFSTLLFALPAFAQDTSPSDAAPAAPADAKAKDAQLIDPELLKLYLDVIKDIKPISSHRLSLKERVEAARTFTFSPETKTELQNAFGNDDPAHITVQDLPGGGTAIHGKTDVLDHTDPKSGSTLHFDAGTAESVVNRDYSGVKFDLSLPDVKLTGTGDPKLFEMSGIGMHGDNTMGPYNFPVGKSSLVVERMRISDNASFTLDFNNLTVDGDVAAHKKMFDMRYDYRIASIDWGSDKVENINTDVAILNIDGQSMEELADFAETVNAAEQSDAAKNDAILKMFKRFALELSKYHGVIEIRDLSAQYHGQNAGLTGRLTLPNLKQADLDSMQKTYEKLAVHLRLHVPMAMIDEITHRISRKMMEAQAKQSGVPVTDIAVDLVARGLIGKMSDTLVKQQKWAHMEKDELVSVFELKKGKMYLDGHVVNAKSNPFMAMAQGK